MARCWCTCGARFNGGVAFDLHRTGSFETRDRKGRLVKPSARRCLSAAEMARRGMVQTVEGYWGTGKPFTGRFSAPPPAHTPGSVGAPPAA
jgi:hypothetical protein